MEEKQIIIRSKINPTTSKSAYTGNTISSFPKLLLTDFNVDPIKYPGISNNSGAKSIKVREDLISDLKEIKKYLNNYDIPLSCQAYNISIDNNFISDFARVGLEIRLNLYAGLTQTINPEYSNYYISPDEYIKNKLRVYGRVTRNLEYIGNKYTPTKRILDVYDIRETYLKNKPNTIKVYKSVLDITKIFEDFGFLQKEPDEQFFLNSDNLKSNWFVFYKPSKINIGYTYKELLSTVYNNNNEPIWMLDDRRWDGKKFK